MQQAALSLPDRTEQFVTRPQDPVLFRAQGDIYTTGGRFFLIQKLDLNPISENLFHLRSRVRALTSHITKLYEENEARKTAERRANLNNFSDTLSARSKTWLHVLTALKEASQELDISAEKFEAFFRANQKVKISEMPRKKTPRNKRGLFTNIFDIFFGGSSLDDAILNQIKDNVATLYTNQESLHEAQKDLVAFSNTSRLLVSQNRQFLIELETDFHALNSSLRHLQTETASIQSHVVFLTSFSHTILRLTIFLSRMDRLNQQLHSFHHLLSIMAHHRLDPAVIAPSQLSPLIADMLRQLRQFPHFKLPLDQFTPTELFYQLTRVRTQYSRNTVFLILDVPLVHIESRATVMDAIPLPIFMTKENVTYQLELDDSFLLLTKDEQYYSIMPREKVIPCLLSQGHFCDLPVPWLSRANPKGCLMGLFANISTEREKCLASTSTTQDPLPFHIGRAVWAVPTFSRSRTILTCVDRPDTKVVFLKPPLSFLHLPPGCTARNPEIYLTTPMSFQGNHTMDDANWKVFTSINWTSMITPVFPPSITKPEDENFVPTIPLIQHQPLPVIKAKLQELNTNYPVRKLRWWQLLVIGLATAAVAVFLLILCCKCKLYKDLRKATNPRKRSKKPDLEQGDFELIPTAPTIAAESTDQEKAHQLRALLRHTDFSAKMKEIQDRQITKKTAANSS